MHATGGMNCAFVFGSQETFDRLHSVLEQAQRVSPTAIRAVVGTKADLGAQREVTTQEALLTLPATL